MSKASPSTSRRRGGSDAGPFSTRTTPTVNNAHFATPSSKAQVLCHNCVSGEQLVLTFRTKHPGLTQDMVRAAKVRFIAHCLPHVRGSSVRQYTDFVRAYRDFAPNLEAEAIISMLMQKQAVKLSTRRAGFPGCFRSLEDADKFVHEAERILVTAGVQPFAPVTLPASRPRSLSTSVSRARSSRPARRMRSGSLPGPALSAPRNKRSRGDVKPPPHRDTKRPRAPSYTEGMMSQYTLPHPSFTSTADAPFRASSFQPGSFGPMRRRARSLSNATVDEVSPSCGSPVSSESPSPRLMSPGPTAFVPLRFKAPAGTGCGVGVGVGVGAGAGAGVGAGTGAGAGASAAMFTGRHGATPESDAEMRERMEDASAAVALLQLVHEVEASPMEALMG